MRLIDADKLIKEITIAQETLQTSDDKQWERNKKYFKGLAWAHKIVLEQPTIEGELKWIPASEPPKESGAYFATIDDSFAKESKLGITVYDGSNWNTWGNIIAWMPLPEAYKGE